MQNKEIHVSHFLTNERIKKPYENSFMLVNHCIEKARAALLLGQGSETECQNVVTDVLSGILNEQDQGKAFVEHVPEPKAPRLVEPSDVNPAEILAQAGYTTSS